MHATKEQMKQVDRLKRRSDFLRVQKAGIRWVSKGLVLQVADNGTDRPRFGLTVTKRLEKSSVRRNRMKRRLRAAAYEVLSEKAKPGVDYIISARTETADRLFTDLCRDLEWCLGKMGYLRESEKG